MADVPQWLESLVEVIGSAMESHAPGPMGLRYREEDGEWDVLVYPLPVELIGGAHDGEVVAPTFSLDVEHVRAAFTRVDDLTWTAHAVEDEDETPCVSFEGEYDGRDVWLRVLAYPPEDEEPETKIDTNL
jgi:hypothetical protein